MKKLKPVSITLLLIIPLIFLVQTQIQAQNIFNAVLNGDLTKVKELIEKGADINAPRDDFMTPLMMAGINVSKVLVETGLILIIKLLIEAGLDKDARTIDGKYFFFTSGRNGNEDIFWFRQNSLKK